MWRTALARHSSMATTQRYINLRPPAIGGRVEHALFSWQRPQKAAGPINLALDHVRERGIYLRKIPLLTLDRVEQCSAFRLGLFQCRLRARRQNTCRGRRRWGYWSLERTSSLICLPSTVCPATRTITAFMTAPISFSECAPVSWMAVSTMAESCAMEMAWGR